MSKEIMLKKLEQYELVVPNAKTKTMSSSLRKEVRNFIKTYLGDYSKELTRIKQLKYDEFLEKNKKETITKILKDKKLNNLMTSFSEKIKAAQKIYSEVYENDKLSIYNTIYNFDNKDYSKVEISENYVTDFLRENFKKFYGSDFENFKKVIQKFEEMIEKSLLFGTVTDVYKIIEKYSQFDDYLKKISSIKIEKVF